MTNQAVNDAIARARARLAEIKAAEAAKQQATAADLLAKRVDTKTVALSASRELFQIDKSREWNDEQRSAILMGLQGKSFVLMGAAGTGKTSTLKGLVNSMMQNSLLPIISGTYSTPVLTSGKPGIVLCSFTNMAVRQIAKHFGKDVTTCTIHKLLEFAPVAYEVTDPTTGLTKTTMRFEPRRNSRNQLPNSLRTIIVDESSMVDTELINLLIDALPNPEAVQWIFVGDLNQLPPVYGRAILGRKLLELPTVELTQVYRQALESPIISLATKIRLGESIPVGDTRITLDNGEHGKAVINPWSKAVSGEDACIKAGNFLKAAIRDGVFDPYKDMALCPKNVAFGTLELNRMVSDYLGKQRNALVFEIIAGFNTHYYAVGDKVLVNKREAVITAIMRNNSYYGKRPLSPLVFELDRWGGAKKHANKDASGAYMDQNDMDVDAVLSNLLASSTGTEVVDRKTQSSHTIVCRFLNGQVPDESWYNVNTKLTSQARTMEASASDELYEEAVLETAAEVNATLFGYVVTVHKSQGSEWRKVILILHQSHAAMCSRELVYTAITRAAKELYIICEPDRSIKPGTLTKASKNPRIKGNTLVEKLASLKEIFDKEDAAKAEQED
jgi:ATP-dependent exoDNAse (exonuclease V) alpha subunit